MKTTITFELNRAEIKAMAKYQDETQGLINEIASAVGIDKVTPNISAWQKIKLALGKEETISGTNSNRGIHNDWSLHYSKRGIRFNVTVETDTVVITEIYAMYGDVFKAYAPVITATIAGVTAANVVAEERVKKSMRVLKKL